MNSCDILFSVILVFKWYIEWISEVIKTKPRESEDECVFINMNISSALGFWFIITSLWENRVFKSDNSCALKCLGCR